MLTPWGVIISIYRMFLRVFFRVRVILDYLIVVVVGHPPALLGGLWGGRSPGVFAVSAPQSNRYSVIYGDVWKFLPAGRVSVAGGVPHKSLLDLLVRTDTKGVGRGFKGDPTVPLRCQFCGLPIKSCDCIAGRDY